MFQLPSITMEVRKVLKKFIKQHVVLNIRYVLYRQNFNRVFRTHALNTDTPIRFVIFSFPRSGSELLCSKLHSHPDILCHRELFHRKGIFYSIDFHKHIYDDREVERDDLTSGKVGLDSMEGRNRSPENFMIKIWKHNLGFKAIGFKIFPSHIPDAEKLLLIDKDIKKILLLRRNKVRCYVSNLAAKKTRVWSHYKEGVWTAHQNNSLRSETKLRIEDSKQATVTVDIDKLNEWCQFYDEYFDSVRQYLIKSGQSFIELAYEDLIGDKHRATESKLLDFIGVSTPPHPLQVLLKKQNSRSLSDMITNFSELQEKFAGTHMESMLYS